MKHEGFLETDTNTSVNNLFEILNETDDEKTETNDCECDSERENYDNEQKMHIIAKPRNTLKMGIWNTANRLEQNIGKLETYCRDQKIQLLGITEAGSTEPDCKKYKFIGKIKTEKKGHHSLGFLVDPQIEKSVHHITS